MRGTGAGQGLEGRLWVSAHPVGVLWAAWHSLLGVRLEVSGHCSAVSNLEKSTLMHRKRRRTVLSMFQISSGLPDRGVELQGTQDDRRAAGSGGIVLCSVPGAGERARQDVFAGRQPPFCVPGISDAIIGMA